MYLEKTYYSVFLEIIMDKKVPAIQAIEKLSYGEHLCSIYSNRDEQMSVIIPFILAGLKRNDKCIYIVDENTKEDIVSELEKHIEIGSFIESQQMEFLTKEEAYLKDGFFDPDRMINLLKDVEREAVEQGYSGLTVTGEMTWVLSNLPGVERLIEYEAKLNYFFPKSKCVAVCQYNENLFEDRILVGVIHTHPKLILHGFVTENPYYIPPDVLLLRKGDFVSEQLYGLLKDRITGKQETEDMLKKSKDYIYSILRTIPSAIFVVDKAKRITLWNSAAERITGLRAEEVVGKKCIEILRSPQCIKKCLLYSEDVQKPIIARRCEIHAGGVKTILKSADYLRDETGNIIGGIEAFEDISVRIKLEEKLKEEKKIIEDLNETLRLINSILRHDLLNDLSAIRATIEYYFEVKDDRLLEKVIERIDRSAKLINKMRELEELSKFRELKPIRVKEVLEEVVGNYDVRVEIEGDGIVEANEALSSVFDNIIRNAVKHGGADRIYVTIVCVDGYCEIRIADNGRGIPDSIRDRIFEKGVCDGPSSGSGLGLYIVKRLIDGFGGKIDVEKNYPTGEVFIIRLKEANG